jgi:dTDP-4-dehydrorhamnose reductase
MQKILITGANGLLGQKLVQLLANNPAIELIATARGKSRLSISEGFSYQEMDLSNPVQIQEVIDKVRPDSIIHTAAMTNVDICHQNPEGCWEANVTAVEYLIEQCQRHNIYLCHVSTDFVFDGESIPIKKTTSPLLFRFMAKVNTKPNYAYKHQVCGGVLSALFWSMELYLI